MKVCGCVGMQVVMREWVYVWRQLEAEKDY